jgi:hypothetical protein
MSCISATFWISVLSMASIGLSSDLDGYYESYGFEKYDGVYVMDCLAV